MATQGDPIRLRHLINQLKRMRTEAEVAQEDVATEMGWDRSKVVRIESGKVQTVKASDVRALCDLFGVPESRKAALVDLAKRARKPGWWQTYDDVLPDAYVALEEDASYIFTYQSLCIPGLLQTPEYAAELAQAAGTVDQKTIRRRAETRSKRSEILTWTNPPRVWAVIDEAALRRTVGGVQVMRAQVERLLELGALAHVNIQILTLDVGGHAAMGGPFVVLDFPTSATVVYVETDTDGLYLEKDSEITRYRLVGDLIQDKALSTGESAAYLENQLTQLAE